MGGKRECYRCGKEGHWSKDCPKGPSRPRGDRYGGGGGGGGRDPYPRDPYDYYRDRYPPPPLDRFRPYPDPYDRRPPPPRDPYYRDRDPYARPPPEYYGRRYQSFLAEILIFYARLMQFTHSSNPSVPKYWDA